MTQTPIKFALIVSIMLNLVLVGILSGSLLKHPRDQDRQPPGQNTSLANPIPPAERRIIGEALRSAHESAAEERQAYTAAKQDLYATLTADTLDVPLAEAQFATMSEKEALMRSKMQAALLTKFPELTARQRERIAKVLVSSGRQDRTRRRRGGPNRPDRGEP